MSAWLTVNLILFAASLFFAVWGSRIPAEGGMGYGLISIVGFCSWAVWVLFGSVLFLALPH